MLDRQVRDAPARVDHARTHDRAGGAGRETRAAAAASPARRLVHGQRDRHRDACQQHVGASDRGDDRSVFSREPEPGPLRDGAVERPAVIDEPLCSNPGVVRPEPVDQRVTASREEIVIVGGLLAVGRAGVGREPTSDRPVAVLLARSCRLVRPGKRDQRLRPRVPTADVRRGDHPLPGVPGHAVHPAFVDSREGSIPRLAKGFDRCNRRSLRTRAGAPRHPVRPSAPSSPSQAPPPPVMVSRGATP